MNLSYLANRIKEFPGTTYTINGYADSATGTPAFNEKLSLKRAQVVKDLLVKKYGIPADNLKVAAGGGVDKFGQPILNRVVLVEGWLKAGVVGKYTMLAIINLCIYLPLLVYLPTTSPCGYSSFPKEESSDTIDFQLSSILGYCGFLVALFCCSPFGSTLNAAGGQGYFLVFL